MGLRTGIIGLGTVARNNHLPALDRNPRTELVAVCDVDGERARETGFEYGARPYVDPETMLADEPLEWVHVATPVQLHRDHAAVALAAGVPVIVQKPATVALDELDELAALADDRGVPLSIVHNWLYYPAVRDLRRRLAAGAIGRVLGVETTFTGEGRPDETYRGSWVFDLPGGEFEEGMPHPIYLTLAIGGYPKDVDAIDVRTRTSGGYEHDIAYDGTQIQYVSEDDALCSVTFLSGSARHHELRVYGERGSLTVDIPAMTLAAYDAELGPYHFFPERVKRNAIASRTALGGLPANLRNRAIEHLEKTFGRHVAESSNGHYYLFDEAARALVRGERPPESLARSRWTIRIMELVREAAAPPSLHA